MNPSARALGCALAVTALLSGCASQRNPVERSEPAQLAALQRDAETERKLGEVLSRLLSFSRRPYDDDALAAYVSGVLERLAAHAERPELRYRVAVLNETEPNAYSLPGGYLYVTRGMLAALNSEAELAAVLGHEIAHSALRHSLTRLLDPLDDEPLAAALRGHAEREADRVSIQLLSAAGYDPRALLDMLEALDRASGSPSNQCDDDPHPTHPARVARAELALPETPAGERGRARYLEAIAGLVVGRDPRDGRLVKRRFVHDRSGLSFEIPAGYASSLLDSGWLVANHPTKGGLLFMGWAGSSEIEAAALAALKAQRFRSQTLLGYPSIATREENSGSEILGLRAPRELYLLMRSPPDEGGAAPPLNEITRTLRRGPVLPKARPRRLRLLRATGEPLATLAGCGLPGDLPLLARLNALSPTQRLPRGRLVKCLDGDPEAPGT